jgi:hypothetical protein
LNGWEADNASGVAKQIPELKQLLPVGHVPKALWIGCVVELAGRILRWLTEGASGAFYRGECCQHLHQFAAGMLGMNGVQEIRNVTQVDQIQINT